MLPDHSTTAATDAPYSLRRQSTAGKSVFTLCLLLAAACILAGQCFLLYHHVPRIISDGYGYWSYLPSYLLLDDPTFSTFAAQHADTPLTQGLLKNRDGTFLQKYGIGVAILQSPFFWLADVAARSGGWQRDGYSPPYQIAATLAPAVYALLGLGLLMAALRPLYPAGVVGLATLLLFLGTNAYHYATFDGSFSHIFSFFLAAALLYVLFIYRQSHIRLALLTGLILGIMMLVRPTNALYILFIGGVLLPDRIRTNGSAGLWRAIRELALCCLIAGALFFIQLGAWHAATGKRFVYPYDGEYFEFLSPHLGSFLFSPRKGLFFWHPLFFVAIAGLFFVQRPHGYRTAATLFLAVFIYVAASWYCWWYGGTLGQRVFVDVIPLLLPGFAALLALKNRFVRLGVTGMCLLLAMYSIFCTWFYWVGVIPPDGATLHDIAQAWRFLQSWLSLGMSHLF